MDGLLILAIETATGCGSVALTRGDVHAGTVLAEYSLYPELAHSRRLLGMVEEILSAAQVSWQAIDALAVSQGPGSFTGLRIGMAAAQGLAFAVNKPLIGVPTLDALRAQVAQTNKTICCLLDARKNQVYAALDRNGVTSASPDACLACTPAQLAARINEPTLCCGPGIRVCATILEAHPQIEILPASLFFPRAASLGLVAAGLAGQGFPQPPARPFYVRASEAEINRDTQHKKEVLS